MILILIGFILLGLGFASQGLGKPMLAQYVLGMALGFFISSLISGGTI